jgi:hypothetical protein
MALDRGDRMPDRRHAVGLGHDNIGQPRGGGAANDFNVGFEERTLDIMHPGADPAMPVFATAQELADQHGVGGFIAGGSAVFAIESDVEYRAQLLLQRERLAHQLFGAGVVVACRYGYWLAAALEQNLGRMHVRRDLLRNDAVLPCR